MEIWIIEVLLYFNGHNNVYNNNYCDISLDDYHSTKFEYVSLLAAILNLLLRELRVGTHNYTYACMHVHTHHNMNESNFKTLAHAYVV